VHLPGAGGPGADRRVPAPAVGPRRLRAMRAAAAAVLPGDPAAADVAAALRGRALPVVLVVGLVGGARRRGPAHDRARRLRRGPGLLRGAVLHMALGRVSADGSPRGLASGRELAQGLARAVAGDAGRVRAVFLDALGTLLALEPPAPRLVAALAQRGVH